VKVVPFDSAVAQANGIIFYSMPQNLDINNVDFLLRPTVETINASGWVWTSECCQGHPDADGSINTGWDHNTHPFMRLITKQNNCGKLLGKLLAAMRLPERTCICRLHTVARGEWVEVIVYVEAVNVLQRNQGITALSNFASALHEAGQVAPTLVDAVIEPPRHITSSRLHSLAEKMVADPRFSGIVGFRVASEIQNLLKTAARQLAA
jgi:hypothetical protein